MPDLPALAPDFTLADTNNEPVSLSFFRGKYNVLLVLNRGFACAFCRQYMTQLRRDIARLTDYQTIVLVIAPEQPDAVRSFWRKEQLPFIGLADPEHNVAALYRQEANMFQSGRLPATILVDRAGRIRKTYYGSSAADIPTMDTIWTALNSINATPV